MDTDENVESEDEESKAKKQCLPGDITTSDSMSLVPEVTNNYRLLFTVVLS